LAKEALMADVTVKILQAASSYAFMTLEEAKTFLGIPAVDTSGDAQLQMLIDQQSAWLATEANRQFAYEHVRETWRWIDCPPQSPRIYLTHWPVKEDDIESVESPEGNVLDPSLYEIEEESGKITILDGMCDSPTVITYWGGYLLPIEAPAALKQALGIALRSARTEAAQAAVAGIRSLSHKEARVMFFDPNARGGSGATGGGLTTQQMSSVKSLLSHYMRYPV
jgi:hypothetical protein